MVRRSESRPDAETIVEAIRPELRSYFPAALLGRLVTVPFYPLGDQEIEEIIALKLAEVQRRVWQKHLTDLTYDPEVVKAVAKRCTEVDSGARNIDYILSDSMLPELSTKILEYMADGEPLGLINVGLADGGGFDYALKAREIAAS